MLSPAPKFTHPGSIRVGVSIVYEELLAGVALQFLAGSAEEYQTDQGLSR